MTSCHSPAQPTWHGRTQMNALLVVGPQERSLRTHFERDRLVGNEEQLHEPIYLFIWCLDLPLGIAGGRGSVNNCTHARRKSTIGGFQQQWIER